VWIAAASGATLTLAFPEPDVAPVAWVALAPLLAGLRGAGARRGALLGAAFGAAFFGTLLYWVAIVGYAAWFALVLLQTAYAALFGALWASLSRGAGVFARVLGPAALWVSVVELLRSITPVVGFPWGQLAQSQHDVPVVLRPAGWAGSWLVAFLLVAVNALVVETARALRGRDVSAGTRLAGAAAVLLVFPAAVPAARPSGPEVDVAIVQGDIPEDRPASYEKDRVILDNHVRLTATVPEDADLVLWPESSVGIDPARDPEVAEEIRAAAAAIGRPLIVGGNLAREDGDYQVMAYLVSESGKIVDAYQKTHLVPFGEYVPARALLGWIPALDQVPLDAVPGDEPGVFEVAGGRVAPVLSFEADFGALVAGRVRAGGQLVVSLTNTSTWRHSWASAQHVAMAQVRAVETGAYVAHAALTGISAFVAPTGEVLARSALWEPDVLVQRLRFAEEGSLYARTGDWFALACAAASLLWVAITVTKRRSGTPPPLRRPGRARRTGSPPATR
jgi:apolipoprotein N-acyltransferase